MGRGLLPYTGTLAALHQKHGLVDVFERARIAFEVEAEASGFLDAATDEAHGYLGQSHLSADGGTIEVAVRYRILSARKRG